MCNIGLRIVLLFIMIAFPHCKINLGLKILRKRHDGYHDLETCFYPVQWTDILEIVPCDTSTEFQMTGHEIPGSPDDNLCLRAYRLLSDQFDLPPVKIHLHKILPTGAGLGGGSSDAAFTLRLLNAIFELKLSSAQMISYAAKLGSDCAFFIQDQPMFAEGRGEILEITSVSLSNKFIVLVKPAVHVSTSQAFSGIKPGAPGKNLKTILNLPLIEWKDHLSNDFEVTIFQKFPELLKIKEQLYQAGAVYASMSGSGSALFGIFDKAVDLSAEFPGCIVWSNYLR